MIRQCYASVLKMHRPTTNQAGSMIHPQGINLQFQSMPTLLLLEAILVSLLVSLMHDCRLTVGYRIANFIGKLIENSPFEDE